MIRSLSPIRVCTNSGQRAETPTAVPCSSRAIVSESETTPYFEMLYGPMPAFDRCPAIDAVFTM